MQTWFKQNNPGVVHGCWGEDIAVNYLYCNGYDIIERNVRPHRHDRRLEIDIVAVERETSTIVFVEVKQHAKISKYSRRLQSIDYRKRLNLRRACNAWRRQMKWKGAFRFDVIEIYGVPEGGRPIVDHIQRVNLFPVKGRFVNWN